MNPDDRLKKLVEGIKVVPNDVAEESAFVVCGYPPPSFPDDIGTFCSKCGMGIVHRPHAPKKPPKICTACFLVLFAQGPGDVNVTQTVRDDVFQFINSTQAGADFIKKKFGL